MNDPNRRFTDRELERIEARLDELSSSLMKTNARIDEIVRAPMRFAAWSLGMIFLAFFSALGVKIYQVIVHFLNVLQKVW